VQNQEYDSIRKTYPPTPVAMVTKTANFNAKLTI